MEEDIRALVKEELEKFNSEDANSIYATETEFRTHLQKITNPRIEEILEKKVTEVIKETV